MLYTVSSVSLVTLTAVTMLSTQAEPALCQHDHEPSLDETALRSHDRRAESYDS